MNATLHDDWKQDARQLLEQLEAHWHPRIHPRELHQRLKHLLLAVKHELSHDTSDARMVASTYRRLLEHQASRSELQQANQALERIFADLGLTVASVLPLAFVTVPSLFSLARHFGIDLLPEL